MRITEHGVEATGSKIPDFLIGQCWLMYSLFHQLFLKTYFNFIISFQGDFDMMIPLFKMYLDALPLVEARSEAWYGHPGGFFSETLNFWGTFESAGSNNNNNNIFIHK